MVLNISFLSGSVKQFIFPGTVCQRTLLQEIKSLNPGVESWFSLIKLKIRNSLLHFIFFFLLIFFLSSKNGNNKLAVIFTFLESWVNIFQKQKRKIEDISKNDAMNFHSYLKDYHFPFFYCCLSLTFSIL